MFSYSVLKSVKAGCVYCLNINNYHSGLQLIRKPYQSSRIISAIKVSRGISVSSPNYIDDGQKELLKDRLSRQQLKVKDNVKAAREDIKALRKDFSEKLQRENVYTIPNLLCVIRIALAPALGYMVVHQQYCPSIAIFAFAGVTDLLDGWIARVFPSQSSVMGTFLDPLADKILVGVLFVSLTYMNLIPVPLTALIIARDSGLIFTGFYIRYKSLDPPRTLSRYFNVSYPTAKLSPSLLSKVNTGIQLGLVGATLMSTILPYNMSTFLYAAWWITAATTIGSGGSYLFNMRHSIKFLRKGSSDHTLDSENHPHSEQMQKLERDDDHEKQNDFSDSSSKHSKIKEKQRN